MRSTTRLSGDVLAVVGLVLSARRARTHVVGPAEERVFRWINEGPDAVHVLVWAVMQAGSLGAVFVVAAERLRRGREATAAATLVTGVSVWAGVKLLKPLIGRGRPSRHLSDVSVRGQEQTGLGFPSGHAAVSLTLALVAARDSGPGVRTAAYAVAGATGGARIYVGAHLPLDVVGGFAIGVLCGRAADRVVAAVIAR